MPEAPEPTIIGHQPQKWYEKVLDRVYNRDGLLGIIVLLLNLVITGIVTSPLTKSFVTIEEVKAQIQYIQDEQGRTSDLLQKLLKVNISDCINQAESKDEQNACYP